LAKLHALEAGSRTRACLSRPLLERIFGQPRAFQRSRARASIRA